MRTGAERFDLAGRRRAQKLGAQPHMGQPDEVGAHLRNEERRVVPLENSTARSP